MTTDPICDLHVAGRWPRAHSVDVDVLDDTDPDARWSRPGSAVLGADEDRALAVADRMETGTVDINHHGSNAAAPLCATGQRAGRRVRARGHRPVPLPEVRPPPEMSAMRAAVQWTAGGAFDVRDVEFAGPGPGEVGVRPAAADLADADEDASIILLRPETSPEDVPGMAAAAGIITATGGLSATRPWSRGAGGFPPSSVPTL